MAKTESEILFEKFSSTHGICTSKIREVQGYRRADYKVRASHGVAVVEVKEITPNKDDIRHDKELSEQGWSSIGGTPGERVRSSMRSASGQLKKFSQRGVPTMVVIYDATNSASYTDPYNVKTAMYGLDAIVFSVPQDQQKSPYRSGVKSGGKQVMTPVHTTSISAVSILQEMSDKSIALFVYHNKFARVSFDPECLRPVGVEQFRLQDPDGATIPDWIRI